MRILITGGSGYIGSRLVSALLERSDVDEIVNVDVAPPRGAPHPRLRYVERSVTEDLADLFTDRARPIDLAAHLAWVMDPLHDAPKQRRICIGGTERLLAGCSAGSVRRLFFMSSATVYGASPAHAEPVDESEPFKDRWHFQYSAEKAEAEALFRRYERDHRGALLQIARPWVVGGPNASNYIFRAIDRKLNFRALGLNPRLQFVHEDDCVAAIAAILASEKPGVFNIASDGELTLADTYAKAGARVVVLPLPVLVRVAELAWRHGWKQIAEAPGAFVYFIAYPWLASNRRLKEELGFRFSYTAEQTIDAFLEARRREVAAASR